MHRLAWALGVALAGCASTEPPAGAGAAAPPAAVVHMADMIQPGGERVTSRSTSPSGWRIVTTYPAGTPGRVRSLLLDDAGRVLERSHSLEPAAAGDAAMREAARRGGGEVTGVEAVQGPGGAEWLRCTVRRPDGSVVQVDLD